MTSMLSERVDDIERRFRGLERELREVRTMLVTEAPPEPLAASAPPPVVARPVERVAPPQAPRRVTEPRQAPARSLVDVLEEWDLLGARGFALVGGVVTLLGIAFFFVLAANHGWIGPLARVLLGGGASVAVFGAGLVLRRRFGQFHAALAAVGTGVAGGYTTLLAAAAIYHLLPEAAALAFAAVIAALAVAVALAWSSEVVAGLGLLGAAAVPALHALDGTLTARAVGFVVLLFGAAVVVCERRGWLSLLGLVAAATWLQVLWLCLVAPNGDAGTIAVGGVLFALLLGAALAVRRGAGTSRAEQAASSLALASAGLALVGSLTIFGNAVNAGIAVLAAAGVTAAALAAASFLDRRLATVLGGLALALVAVGTADVLSTRSLTLVWAAESLVLTGIGLRLRETRFRLAALAYVPLALFHALAVEAPLDRLFETGLDDYAAGVPSLLAVGAAVAFAGWRPPAAGLDRVWPSVRLGFAGLSALIVLDAVSLLVIDWRFATGHLVVTGLFGVLGLAAVAVGARSRSDVATTVGFAWLVLVYVKVLGFDWSELGHGHGAVSLLGAGTVVLLAGVALRVLDDRPEPLALVSGVCASIALVSLAGGFAVLVDEERPVGLALIAPVVLYAALAAATFRVARLRNLTTVLWAHALVALLLVEALVVQGRAVAVAAAATAAGLALLAGVVKERRLHVGAALVLGATTLVTLAVLTTPDRLVHATEHPGVSLWVLAVCVAAGVVLAVRDREWRSHTVWVCATLAVYGVSLGILDLAERISTESVATDVQRGQTVVTALWALIGLGLLVAGLLRRVPALRFGGLAVFGFALAKLFLYDLSALSSVTRALSFLAVGALMLAGGFFLQRLRAQLDEHPGT